MATRLSRQVVVDIETISEAALELFANHGYQSTSMDDIGGALGIKGPSLSNHVRSKQELLVRIMVEAANTLIRNQISATEAGGDFATRLRRAVEAHIRYHA